MKTVIEMPKKYLYLIYSLFAITCVAGGIILFKNHTTSLEKKEELYLSELKGIVFALKDESKGFYYLGVKNGSEKLEIHDLRFRMTQKESNIQIGDSIFKPANSRGIKIIKLKNNKIDNVFDLEFY